MSETTTDSNSVDLKVSLLRELRELYYDAALTNQPSPVDIVAVAERLVVPERYVRGTIAELRDLGYLRPTDASAPHRAVTDGACAITTEGLKYLNDYEIMLQGPRLQTKWRPAGFDLRPGSFVASEDRTPA